MPSDVAAGDDVSDLRAVVAPATCRQRGEHVLLSARFLAEAAGGGPELAHSRAYITRL